MGVILLGSAKGSPGVSTTTLALAAAWPGAVQPVVVEADVAGSDALLRFGLRESPGLVSLAAASRRVGLASALVHDHAQRLSGGVEVVVGPVEAGQCTATLGALGPVWADAELDGTLLLADCGRLTLASGTAELLRVADAVVLVSGGAVEALAHTAEAAERLRGQVGKVLIAVVGSCPWPAQEVEAALGADACAMLPNDPGSAALLRGGPARKRRWPAAPRYPLMDAARRLALALERLLPEPQVADDDSFRQTRSDPLHVGADLASASRGENT